MNVCCSAGVGERDAVAGDTWLGYWRVCWRCWCGFTGEDQLAKWTACRPVCGTDRRQIVTDFIGVFATTSTIFRCCRLLIAI